MLKTRLDPKPALRAAVISICAACSSGETEIVTRIPLPTMSTGGAGGTVGAGGSAITTGGAAGSAPTSGGSAGTATTGGSGSGGAQGGGAGTSTTGGSDASGGTGAGGSGGAPTTGHFQMLVFSKTAGYRHGSIAAGQTMLMTLASQNDFEVTTSEDATIFSDAGLDPFQVIFFLNTTDDILDAGQQTAMENFIHKGRGFAGVHSATDTEDGFGWAWYQELVGSDYNGHGDANTPGTLTVDVGALNHPATMGLPQSWNRNEEWYLFKRDVSALTGVQVLLRFSGDNRPMAWTREWEGGRSFYTACGHDASAFQEPLLQQHILGGILWVAHRIQ